MDGFRPPSSSSLSSASFYCPVLCTLLLLFSSFVLITSLHHIILTSAAWIGLEEEKSIGDDGQWIIWVGTGVERTLTNSMTGNKGRRTTMHRRPFSSSFSSSSSSVDYTSINPSGRPLIINKFPISQCWTHLSEDSEESYRSEHLFFLRLSSVSPATAGELLVLVVVVVVVFALILIGRERFLAAPFCCCNKSNPNLVAIKGGGGGSGGGLMAMPLLRFVSRLLTSCCCCCCCRFNATTDNWPLLLLLLDDDNAVIAVGAGGITITALLLIWCLSHHTHHHFYFLIKQSPTRLITLFYWEEPCSLIPFSALRLLPVPPPFWMKTIFPIFCPLHWVFALKTRPLVALLPCYHSGMGHIRLSLRFHW